MDARHIRHARKWNTFIQKYIYFFLTFKGQAFSLKPFISVTCYFLELFVSHPLEDFFKEGFTGSSSGSFTVYVPFHDDDDCDLADVQLAFFLFIISFIIVLLSFSHTLNFVQHCFIRYMIYPSWSYRYPPQPLLHHLQSISLIPPNRPCFTTI